MKHQKRTKKCIPRALPTTSVHCAYDLSMDASETRMLGTLKQPLLYAIAKQQCSSASKGGRPQRWL
ncbi:MAG: hypothetical protein V7707_12680 [Motiliproteus sp.]